MADLSRGCAEKIAAGPGRTGTPRWAGGVREDRLEETHVRDAHATLEMKHAEALEAVFTHGVAQAV